MGGDPEKRKLKRKLRAQKVELEIKKYNRIHVDFARERARDMGLDTGGECLEDFCGKKALDDDYFCFDCGRE